MGLSWSCPKEEHATAAVSSVDIAKALPSVRPHKKSRTVITKRTVSQKKAEKLKQLQKESAKDAKKKKAEAKRDERVDAKNRHTKRTQSTHFKLAKATKRASGRSRATDCGSKKKAIIPEALITFLQHRQCPTLSC
jgi:hypothetical protein